MIINVRIKDMDLLKRKEDVEGIIAKLEECEKKACSECVVLLLQNSHLGGLYRIRTKDDAETSINRQITPSISEWGIEYYDKGHLLKLKETYSG